MLSHFAELPVCVRYRATATARETRDFPAHQSDFHAARPVDETLPGWDEPLDGCASVEDLPDAARAYVDFVERELEVEGNLIGTGAERETRAQPRAFAARARPGSVNGPLGEPSSRWISVRAVSRRSASSVTTHAPAGPTPPTSADQNSS